MPHVLTILASEDVQYVDTQLLTDQSDLSIQIGHVMTSLAQLREELNEMKTVSLTEELRKLVQCGIALPANGIQSTCLS